MFLYECLFVGVYNSKFRVLYTQREQNNLMETKDLEVVLFVSRIPSRDAVVAADQDRHYALSSGESSHAIWSVSLWMMSSGSGD